MPATPSPPLSIRAPHPPPLYRSSSATILLPSTGPHQPPTSPLQVFISHQWLGYHDADPQGVHVRSMRHAVHAVAAATRPGFHPARLPIV